MARYNYFQAIYMSFYSHDLYRDVARNWGAGVILYLVMVLFICWASMMFKYQPLINTSFRDFITQIAPEVPEMNIKDGIVTTPENKPYLIKDPTKGDVIAIIDTSGEYTSMDNVPKSTAFLVTKDTTYFMNSNNEVRVNKISKTLTMDIVPEKIKNFAMKFVGWLWLILLPALLFMSLIYRLVQALFYAIIGKIFSALSNVPLTYAQNLKLSMIAVTPAIIFATVMDWFNISFRFEWLVCFSMTMGFLVCGITSNRETPKQE